MEVPRLAEVELVELSLLIGGVHPDAVDRMSLDQALVALRALAAGNPSVRALWMGEQRQAQAGERYASWAEFRRDLQQIDTEGEG